MNKLVSKKPGAVHMVLLAIQTPAPFFPSLMLVGLKEIKTVTIYRYRELFEDNRVLSGVDFYGTIFQQPIVAVIFHGSVS